MVEQMAAAVKGHALAHELLADGVAEGVVRCEYAQFQCQARIDWINPRLEHGIVDLKTTDELDSFEFALRALGYVHQVAFYRALVAIAGGHLLPVHIVAVEKRERSASALAIAPEVLDQAQAQNEEQWPSCAAGRATATVLPVTRSSAYRPPVNPGAGPVAWRQPHTSPPARNGRSLCRARARIHGRRHESNATSRSQRRHEGTKENEHMKLEQVQRGVVSAPCAR
jgi:hypothetical protein